MIGSAGGVAQPFCPCRQTRGRCAGGKPHQGGGTEGWLSGSLLTAPAAASRLIRTQRYEGDWQDEKRRGYITGELPCNHASRLLQKTQLTTTNILGSLKLAIAQSINKRLVVIFMGTQLKACVLNAFPNNDFSLVITKIRLQKVYEI